MNNVSLWLGQLTTPESVEQLITALKGAAPVLVCILVFFVLVKTILYICPPNEFLVFSGRKQKAPDGTVRGFRVVFGGRGWRVPILERVDRMTLNTMEIPIGVRGAYAQGGIPLHVDAVANVKISSEPGVVGNAIERFLGQPPVAIRRVAKETLEGHLRGVLARLTPEQINEDRLTFAEELANESELDLKKLGLHLDTLKIQHVSDDVKYLDSIGREAIANVVRDAQMAESDARRQAEQIESEMAARGAVALSNADAQIARMENELRKILADLESRVTSEEKITESAAREARARAEQELQGIRTQVEAIRLKVDEVLPAEAAQIAQQSIAEAEASVTRERGLAAGEALSALNSAWRAAGDNAINIVVLDSLDSILKRMVHIANQVEVEEVNIIDNGSGKGLPNYVAGRVALLTELTGALEQLVGFDLKKALGGITTEVRK
ncbi:MAG: hypothetical protein JNJ45_03135 [Chthonomonas sp.]|nr:hypothetical protein [Chthonomonas sp.]